MVFLHFYQTIKRNTHQVFISGNMQNHHLPSMEAYLLQLYPYQKPFHPLLAHVPSLLYCLHLLECSHAYETLFWTLLPMFQLVKTWSCHKSYHSILIRMILCFPQYERIMKWHWIAIQLERREVCRWKKLVFVALIHRWKILSFGKIIFLTKLRLLISMAHYHVHLFLLSQSLKQSFHLSLALIYTIIIPSEPMVLDGMHKPNQLHLNNPILPSIKHQIMGLIQMVGKEVELFCFEEF